MAILTTRNHDVQLVLAEPPEPLLNRWNSDRVFYQRLEGPQPRRDAVPPINDGDHTTRYDYVKPNRDMTSDDMWKILLRPLSESDSQLRYYQSLLGTGQPTTTR